MNRKIAVVAAIVVLCVGGVLLYIRQPLLHTLTVQYSVSPDQAAEVELYSTKPGEQDDELTLDSKVKTVSDDKSTILRRGIYALRTVGENYHENTQYIDLSSSSQDVNYILQYSPDYLDELQAKEKDAVHAAIAQKYPDAPKLYSNEEDTLIGQGEWYVAILRYKGDSGTMRDTLRLVLHKEGDSWRLLTKPRIVLSAVDYPDIPLEVLTHANRILPEPSEKQY